MTAPRKAAVRAPKIDAAKFAEVEFAGHVYRIDRDVSLNVLDAVSPVDDDGNKKAPNHMLATQYLLGAKEWKVWRSRHTSLRELTDFWVAAMGALNTKPVSDA